MFTKCASAWTLVLIKLYRAPDSPHIANPFRAKDAMYDIIFYEVFKEEENAIQRYLPGTVKAQFISRTIQEAGGNHPSAPIISIRTQSRIPDHWAQNLKGILTRATGYDHLLEYRRRTKSKIPCGYLPNYCSRAVAEQAILLMLGLMRKLPLQVKNFDHFKREEMTGFECQGKNILVVGVGRIGREVVDLGLGLRMNVKGVDINPKLKGILYVSLIKGIPWADVVVCALPLTNKTRKLLNYQMLKRASQGLIFINIARGEISPLQDLKRLLAEGILGGLGLDVYEKENFLAEALRRGTHKNHPLLRSISELKRKYNCLFTPHNAFNTVESVERKAKESVESVLYFLKRKTFPDPIPQP